MAKSRAYSIYLLKHGFSADNAIKDSRRLTEVATEKLPDNARCFLVKAQHSQPWWRDGFGIHEELHQILQGAIVFLPCSTRVFVLSFGPGFHHIKEESYEYDFGLIATLNSVDPKKLKSTDTLDPSGAKRRRTQLPNATDLTAFDIDKDVSILKNLTGLAKEPFKSTFRQVTGSSSLRISTRLTPNALLELCRLCLRLYDSKTYQRLFPDIQNIAPLRDPITIKKLNEKLVTALNERSESISLTIPDIIDYRVHTSFEFSGKGKDSPKDDVTITDYYDYINEHTQQPYAISLDNIKQHVLSLIDENGKVKNSYSIYHSLVFETTLENTSKVYHIAEGSWYAIEESFIVKLKDYLDPLCEPTCLPEYHHKSEGEYNQQVAIANANFICLDTTTIHPTGTTNVEPCDLFCNTDEFACFYHVKISTRSSTLSHLLNQGINSIELLRTEEEALLKFRNLLRKKCEGQKAEEYIAAARDKHSKVIYAIITKKDPANLSDNLPLFSRISLYRTCKMLQSMNVARSYCFIKQA